MKLILLCLHGWGGSKESFDELREALQDVDMDILTPDLPGFGKEPEPPKPFTNDDYARWVIQWLQKQIDSSTMLGTDKIYLLGHSHGGRIAIKIAASGNIPIKHLFLCAPAGIQRQQCIKRLLGLFLAKSGKAFLLGLGLNKLQPLARKFLYRLFRVHDFERASPIMKQTLILVTKENLHPLLSQIKIPTDIFWGENDRMTPLKGAFLLQKAIPKALLHTFPGTRHRVHRDRAKEISAIIHARMQGK